MTRHSHVLHKVLDIFKKQNSKQELLYPWALEKYYMVSRKVLGTGSFGVVKLCTDKRTKKQYALKIVNKKTIQGKYKNTFK
jgi:calcium/calmodulin-dependent protein kinase I